MTPLIAIILAGLVVSDVEAAPTPAPSDEATAQAVDVDSEIDAAIKPAGQPFVPPDGPRISADAIIKAFLADVESRDDLPAKPREFLKASVAKLDSAQRQSFLNDSLALLSDGFRLGLEAMERDEPAKAADLFEALTIDDNPYLAVAAANQAATTMVDIEQLDRCGQMLADVLAAHPDIEQYTLDPENFVFMLGYCQLHNLDYDAASGTLNAFLKRYPDSPERLRITATQILTELERRVPGKLGDVRDLMNFARRRIKNGDTGEVVATRQAAAVELLSAMIQEAENQEKSKSNCKKCGGGKCKGGHGTPKGNTNPGGGAKQSALPEGDSRVGELRRTTARPGEEWGRMPPREREQILQTLQRQFPSQYRELLEQYYQQLAKDAQPQ